MRTPCRSRQCFKMDEWRGAKMALAWRLAIPAGLEPATRGVEIRYSIQLSYGTGVARRLSPGDHPKMNVRRMSVMG